MLAYFFYKRGHSTFTVIGMPTMHSHHPDSIRNSEVVSVEKQNLLMQFVYGMEVYWIMNPTLWPEELDSI